MNASRTICLLVCGAAAVLPWPATAQLQPANENVGPGASATDVIPEWQMRFENLTPEIRLKYSQVLTDASRLFNQKRVIEALNRIAEADAIFDDNPVSLNLKGACYVEFRDFENAKACFTRALDLQAVTLEDLDRLTPAERSARMAPVTDIIFNIAEMDFVTHQWQEAHDRLEALLPEISPSKMIMQRLIEFKLLITKIKLGRQKDAEALAAKYDFLDDSPFHYYAESALAYDRDDVEAAERWRGVARRVFTDPGMLAPWEDTMIEAGYLKSFYGGDLEVTPLDAE